MLELLASFSGMQILTFVILFTLAIKGVQDMVDYFRGKYKEKFNKDYDKATKESNISEQLEIVKSQHDETLKLCENFDHKLDDIVDTMNEKFDDLDVKINQMGNNDKHSIKQMIVKDYHYFVEKQGQIDDFSLDTILLLFEDYKQLGGNSYISSLVEELKALPRHYVKKDKE